MAENEDDAPPLPVDPPAADPVDDKVVSLARQRSKRDTEAAAAGSSPAPPSGEERAARKKGDGGDKPVREKKTDWTKYTHLVENFVLIYPTDTAWDRSKRKIVKIANMGHMFGADYVRMWKASDKRKTVDEEELVFDPSGRCGPDAINLWDGMPVEPTPCEAEEIDVMLQLLEHLCSRCQDAPGVAGKYATMQWVLKWLAYPLQHPGAKMRSSLVFHGPQGTGKNLFFDVIRGIYGKYGVMVGQTEVEEKYNGWLSAKQLVVANEVVSRQELYHSKNRIKWIITEDRIPIRTMHTDTRWEDNHANVIFLSNERMPLVLEVGDRRYLVVYTPTPEDGDLYRRIKAFLANDGAAKFFHYLMQLPLGDFDEHTRPPMTEAKEELIELGMKPAERFMKDWIDGFLDLPLQVCSAEQLYRAFRRWCDRAGERWPPAQAAFTNDAKRWAIERIDRDAQGLKLPPCLDYKVVTGIDHKLSGQRKSVRCWLPRGTGSPPNYEGGEGSWAIESVSAFEGALGRFLGHREESADGAAEGNAPRPPTAGKKGKGDGDVTT